MHVLIYEFLLLCNELIPNLEMWNNSLSLSEIKKKAWLHSFHLEFLVNPRTLTSKMAPDWCWSSDGSLAETIYWSTWPLYHEVSEWSNILHSTWFTPKVSMPREWGRSCMTCTGLAWQVCIPNFPRFKWRRGRPSLLRGEMAKNLGPYFKITTSRSDNF